MTLTYKYTEACRHEADKALTSFDSYLLVVTKRKIYKDRLFRESMEKQNKKSCASMARYPVNAFMCIEMAEKFKLPKSILKSEMEELVGKMSVADYSKMAKETEIDISYLMGEELSIEDIERVLDKAKKAGVEKGLITKAATNYIKPYIANLEDAANEDVLLEFWKKYSVKNEDMYNSILDNYHSEYK